MKKHVFAACALGLLFFGSCSPEIQSEIQITCPEDITIAIPAAPFSSAGLILPEPVIFSACGHGISSYSVGIAPELTAGPNTVTLNAKNACGDEASCAFVVTTTVDWRAWFVGNYTGYRDCAAYNTTQLHPDLVTTVPVSYGNAPDRLLVGTDQVTVDSNGYSVYPTFNGYRQYSLKFRNDSVFIYQQWGVINAHEVCHFAGRKD
ncbi:MAG: hypothetical protein IPH12_03615 [Saprospirales bacterium]|jgi:hypothetical protein|nr:hypothetical protein [Saprospirales bacterium]MBK8922399.1 hypothetical protein [Saprospirales bacterium]